MSHVVRERVREPLDSLVESIPVLCQAPRIGIGPVFNGI